MSFLYFNVFDKNTKQLLFTKYSFKFDLYSTLRNLDPNLSKTEIFRLFLRENGTTFDKPYSLSEGLEIFFNPVTQQMVDHLNLIGNTHTNYMTFTNPITYIPLYDLIEEQFDVINYNDSEIRFIEDYTYTTDKNDLSFTKNNFDFDSYSNDFNIWGSKLFIFTDFVVRCINISEAIPGTFGYGLPDSFLKYFLTVQDLSSYLENYGVTSNDKGIFKNPANIDWNSYKNLNPDLNSNDPDVLKQHYYMYGQFELRKFNFLKSTTVKNSDLVKNGIASIYSSAGLSSGFLYSNGDGNIYLITCYHIIKDSANKNIIRASFSINSNDDIVESPSTIAEFLNIGYDIMADIAVYLFDPTLPFNSTFKIDLSPYQTFNLSTSYDLNKGDSVFYLGSIGNISNNSIINGLVMNEKYSGLLDDTFNIGSPDSVLIESSATLGLSGAPIWLGDPNGTDGKITCVGLINSRVNMKDDVVTFTQGIQTKIMVNIINNCIGNWFYFQAVPKFKNNPVLIDYLKVLTSPKTWLGITCSYYNSKYSNQKFPFLNNFPYTGGLVVEDFILGFNFVKKSFITNANELGEFSSIRLNTPLLNSEMYKKYIDTSKTPLVIKSITYFNGFTNEYKKHNLGIYGNQDSYSSITYGLLPIKIGIMTPPDYPDADEYLFPIYQVYPTITIEYFYYNGAEWILEKEVVGGTDKSYYSTYKDNYGNKFYQHTFQLPYILYPYYAPYSDGLLTSSKTLKPVTIGNTLGASTSSPPG
jgi:hypothetical protein